MKAYMSCLLLLALVGSVAGAVRDSVSQRLRFGDVTVSSPTPSPGETAFLLSGKKMYEVGSIDGSFPTDGSPQQEQGVWCHPVKLLSSIGYTIIEEENEWELSNAKTFTYRFHAADFTFEKEDLRIARRDVVAENRPALITTLRIDNRSPRPRSLTVRLTCHVDLRPSDRCAELKRSATHVGLTDKAIVAYNDNGSVVIGNGRTPRSCSVKDSVAILEYGITLPGNGSADLPLLLAGDNRGDSAAAKELFQWLGKKYGQVCREKSAYYMRAVFREGTTFACSDPRLTDAFYCAKANVLLNTCDHAPYVAHPFVRAGVPVYPRLFGTDFCFSTYGLLEGGFHETVRSTLLDMAEYAKEHLRAPHEVSSDGKLLGWDHIQVTPQFIAACADYYAWTSDTRFLEEMYPLCRALLDDVRANADKDGDGFIEGHGLMEESEFKGDWEELSASSYLYTALAALSFMAAEQGDKEQAETYASEAETYRSAFNRRWWNRRENIWNCALSERNEEKPYNFWSVVFPQLSGAANADNGLKAMERVENDWVNDNWGMVGRFQPERNQEHDGVGLVHNNLCATAAFAYGKEELGWKLLRLTSKGVFGLPHSCLGLFPECQPGLCSNISQLWSYATFMESLLHGLAGISVDRGDGTVRIAPSFPDGLSSLSVGNMRIGKERLSLQWERGEGGKISVRVGYSGDPKRVRLPRCGDNVSFTLSRLNE